MPPVAPDGEGAGEAHEREHREDDAEEADVVGHPQGVGREGAVADLDEAGLDVARDAPGDPRRQGLGGADYHLPGVGEVQDDRALVAREDGAVHLDHGLAEDAAERRGVQHVGHHRLQQRLGLDELARALLDDLVDDLVGDLTAHVAVAQRDRGALSEVVRAEDLLARVEGHATDERQYRPEDDEQRRDEAAHVAGVEAPVPEAALPGRLAHGAGP